MTIHAFMVSSAAVAALLAPTMASAQTADDAAEEIVVTGSRVRSPAATATSPVVGVASKAIALQGTPTADSLLNTLPQVSGSNTSGQSTFGTPGIATANLRKLGPTRTLVLIDGRRLMPGDPTLPVADLNFIPTALVSSVEVLTGGASTAYGSDAVAGVINFKLERDLDGIRFDFQQSAYQTDNDNKVAQGQLSALGVPVPGSGWDGWTHDASVAAGHNFGDGRGNVTAFFAYRKAEPVGAIDRDFAACGIGTVSGAQPFDTHVCTGSGTSSFGRFRTGGGLAANPNGTATFVPYTGALAYNSAKENYLQREDTHYSAGVFARYKFSDAIEAYADGMFMDDSTRAQIAPAGIVGNRTYRINCDNPLLSASQATALCGAGAGNSAAFWSGTIAKRVEVPGRPRFYDLQHRDYRGVVGLRGAITDGWTYDVYGQYGRVEYTNDATNDVSISRVQDSLLARNVGGTPQCISGNAGCAPLNIFQLGQISPAAARLIGSATKRARFLSRLTAEGVDAGRLTCPIGIPGLAGKEPAVIAVAAIASS